MTSRRFELFGARFQARVLLSARLISFHVPLVWEDAPATNDSIEGVSGNEARFEIVSEELFGANEELIIINVSLIFGGKHVRLHLLASRPVPPEVHRVNDDRVQRKQM